MCLDLSGTWHRKKKEKTTKKSLLIEFADDTKIGGLRNNEDKRSETEQPVSHSKLDKSEGYML